MANVANESLHKVFSTFVFMTKSSQQDHNIIYYQDDVFIAATVSSASLSLVAASFVIFTCLMYPTVLSGLSVHLLVDLALADLIMAVAQVLPNITYRTCVLQGALLQFGGVLSLCSLLSLAVFRYLEYCENNLPSKWLSIFHFASFSLATVSTLIPLFGQLYGPTDIICWIPSDEQAVIFASFNVPMLVILITFVIFSVKAHTLLSRRALMAGDEHSQHYFHMSRVIFLHTLLLCLINIPALLHRSSQIGLNGQNDNDFLRFLVAWFHALLSPLQGVVNLVLFLTNRHVERVLHLIKAGGVLPPLSRIVYSMTSIQNISDDEIQPIQQAEDSKHPIMLLNCPVPVLPPRSASIKQSISKSDRLMSHRVLVASWNVGSKKPPSSLSQWIDNKHKYDIISVSAQESKYRIGYARSLIQILHPGGGRKNSMHWFDSVTNAVGAGYTIVAKAQLWHLRSIVYIKNSLMPSLHSVCILKEGTGIFNIGGNKGGVCIAFELGPLSYCFLNVHLAAHDGRSQDREFDLAQIFARIPDTMRPLMSYHILVLNGDLNYRFQNINREQVMELLDKADLIQLSKFDELNYLRVHNGLLFCFHEPDLGPAFPCTYKYLSQSKLKKLGINSDGQAPSVLRQYDFNTSSIEMPLSSLYDSQRTPAWTDRILWTCRSGIFADQLSYEDVPAFVTSDHKPIRAAFRFSYITDIDDWYNQTSEDSIIDARTSSLRDAHNTLSLFISKLELGNQTILSGFEHWGIVLSLSSLKLFDCFSHSSLPLLEPFLQMRLLVSFDVPRQWPTLNSCVSTPIYRHIDVNADDTSSQSDDLPLMNDSRLPAESELSRADGKSSLERSVAQSFLIAEWEGYSIPKYSISTDAALEIAIQWGWCNFDTASTMSLAARMRLLLRVVACTQLQVSLRDRSKAGDEDLCGIGLLELRDGIDGSPSSFTMHLMRGCRYSGYLSGIFQLKPSDLRVIDGE